MQSVPSIPRLLNLIPSPPAGIIGRDDEVAATRERLLSGNPAVLVNGIGGIGKTTVALKYLADFSAEYQHIAWVTITDTLAKALVTDRQLTASLGLDLIFTTLTPEQLYKDGSKRILYELSKLNACLLVLDNANKLADLVEWKAALGSCQAHVLLTSRAEPQGWSCVLIESLPLEKARELFRRFYRFESPSDAELDMLLNELTCHTLLVELSAKAAQASRISFDNLFQRLRDGYIRDVLLNARPVDTGQSGESVENRLKIARVETYVELIFSEIAELSVDETAHLKIFTLLPSAEWYNEEKLSSVFQLVESEVLFRSAKVDRLVEKGWLKRADNPENSLAYKMHPLIQEVAVRQLMVTVEWATPMVQAIAEMIEYSSTDSTHNLIEKVKGKPYAEYLEKRFRDGKTEQFSYLLDRIAYLEENFGNYQVAQNLGERALAISLEIFSAEHYKIGVRQCNLANVCGKLGDYARTRDLLEAALVLAIKNFGDDHPSVGVSQANLAVVYGELGNHSRARHLVEAALALAFRNFGADHPTVAARQSSLAVIYGELGDYTGAQNLLEAALASDLKNFGVNHPSVANKYYNLGQVYFSTEKYPLALQLFEKALNILLHNFEASHPNVTRVMRSIIAVQGKMASTD